VIVKEPNRKGIPVTILPWASVLNVIFATVGFQTCQEAYLEAKRSGKPLVVLVCADWCSPCVRMKRYVLPKVDPLLRQRVALAVVDYDRNSRLAERVVGDRRGIPQLIMYTPREIGWSRRLLYGYHDIDQVEKFLREGLPAKVSGQAASGSSKASTDKTDGRPVE
jgi:thioredoxin-like negative regulator of GroEL